MTNEQNAIEVNLPGWTRRAIPQAGVSIAHNGEWPVFEADNVSYQTFGRDNGAVSVHWGNEATIEWYLNHTGLGSGGDTRVIDEDRPSEIGGFTGRCVRLRVMPAGREQGGDVQGHRVGISTGNRETIFVAFGFTVGDAPVRVGYRLPSSERTEFEPLLERVLRSMYPL